jgi:GTP-binding protein HflX
LTYTAGGEVVKRFLKMERPNPKTFVGTGKIHHYVKNGFLPDFDDELTPSQQRIFQKNS